jgi:hypothetical protein
MSVFVSIEDKEGEGLVPVVDVDRIHRRFAEAADSVCLRFISEAEDASFNQLQLPLLVAELDKLAASADLRADEREELTLILRVCRRFQDKPGVHARFYGERGRGE